MASLVDNAAVQGSQAHDAPAAAPAAAPGAAGNPVPDAAGRPAPDAAPDAAGRPAPDAAPHPFHTLALTMSYNGLHFSGFAQQPGQPTVQGSLNNALRILYRRQVETTCAGRTDAGVHAKGQVVSFDVSPSELQGRPLPGLLRSLNALIDDNAAILAIEERAPGFSARFDARSREYRYLIATGEARPVLLADRVWHLGRPLDLEAMRDAAAYLIGEHDFKSFCKAVSAQDKPTNRKVMQIAVEEECLMGENLVVIKVVGNAFLHSMVRTIVGTMVAIGLGNRPARWAQDVLLACDRRAAGQTAPAHGLVFWQVSY